MSQKYPHYPVNPLIASFTFSRYFVAGITVPDSYGIVKMKPEMQVRRKLLLVAKVISNISTNTKFGDEEEYLRVMNDYLESKQQQIENYYKFLLTVFFFFLQKYFNFYFVLTRILILIHFNKIGKQNSFTTKS